MIFNFTVKDSVFPQELEGEVEADNIEEATLIIKDDYAEELGTSQDDLTVKVWI